jgi:putative transposase
MQRLWGRKISDLAFGEFLKILEWVAQKKDKQVIFIDDGIHPVRLVQIVVMS